MSNNTLSIGKWKLKHDLRMRMGIAVFGLSAGAEVTIKAINVEYRNALVEVDSRTIDWMPTGWVLDNFEKVYPPNVINTTNIT